MSDTVTEPTVAETGATLQESPDQRERWAVIGGASGALGSAVARTLDACGFHLALHYHRNQRVAEELAATLTRPAVLLGLDLSEWKTVRDAAEEFVAGHGAPAAIVNCSGVRSDGLMAGQAADEWARTIEVNLVGAFHLTRALLPAMLRARRGAVIHVVSPAGLVGSEGQTAYSASKAGMIGMVRSLARECGRRNVTVNALSPGFMRSAMTETLPAHVSDAIIKQSAIRRLVEPDEVAAMVPAILSCAAMTGQVIGVDGGLGI